MTVMSLRIRTYTELCQFTTFKERWTYLKLEGQVGATTFGFDRYLNQNFYHSREWRCARRDVIVRDRGCDLGLPDYEIYEGLYIHHMNPMTIADIVDGNPTIVDPNYLILVSHDTHNAIHYGDESLLPQPYVARRPGDTKLW